MRKLVSALLAVAVAASALGLAVKLTFAQEEKTWWQSSWTGDNGRAVWDYDYPRDYWSSSSVDTTGSPGDIRLTVVGGDSWSWVRDAVTGALGEAVVGTGENIYVAKGTSFYRFRPADGSWATLTAPPQPDGAAFKTGTALAWDHGNYIYALFGAAGVDVRYWFYRYDIAADSWENLADTPHVQGEADSLTWVATEGRLYAILGGEERWTGFARYDPATNTWDNGIRDPFAGMGDGACIVWDGGSYIYALQGEFKEEEPRYGFLRYDLGTDTWGSRENIPALPHGEKDGKSGVGGVGDGGSLLYVGHWIPHLSDYIYALSGNQAYPEPIPDNRFYRYTISTNRWERLADLPFGVGHYVGNRLAYAGGRIYAWQGTPSTWAGGGDDLAVYLFPTHADNGWLISSAFDTRTVVTWGSITWESTEPPGASVTVETRTSGDLTSWSEWAAATKGGKIPSPDNQYIQYRVTLSPTSDTFATPLFHHVTINYTVPAGVDVTPPRVWIYRPGDGFFVRIPTIRLSGALDDPTIGSVTVLINEVEVTTLSVIDKKFEGTLTLIEGTNKITVRAVDAAGNIGSKSITGRYEPAPPILENVVAVVKGVRKTFTFEHPFILEIRVMPRENANLKIVIETLENLGAVSPPEGTGYAYIRLSSAPAGIIENAEILFAVEFDWLRPFYIKHGTVRLYRYVDVHWEALETNVVRHTETTTEYLAEVPGGFSLFTISGEPEPILWEAVGIPLLFLAALIAAGVAMGAAAGLLSAKAKARMPKRGWTPWG